MSEATRTRWAVAVAAASVTFVVSYALQRLIAAWGAEVPVGTAETWIPFRWRCGLAAVQACTVLVIAGPVLGEGAASVLLRWIPVWVPIAVGLAAAAMLAVP